MEASEVRSDEFKLGSSDSVSRSSLPIFGRDDGAGGRSPSSVRATENSVELWSNNSHGINYEGARRTGCQRPDVAEAPVTRGPHKPRCGTPRGTPQRGDGRRDGRRGRAAARYRGCR